MIVTRFPPSPTGFLHVGGLRTALYNYLFSRQNKGKFILRIEDTDTKRFVQGAVENLIATLKWAGLDYDEGPYIQSQRLNLYKKAAEELLQKGAAYYCFCPPERLAKMRADQKKRKIAPKYDKKCLHLSKSEIEDLLKKNTAHVVRQKIPAEIEIKWTDLVRGEVKFETKDIDDQILIKSDGYPTYHIANVIDDHDMGVTHVIRGEEWLSSTPKHILLYQAFGWKIPEFGHLPLLLNKDKSKLSKRQGDVAVEEYIAKGYLPEAVINFIALLGWNPGKTEQEIFSMQELIEKFSLEKIHKAGAIFDLEKLKWMNWQWRKRKYLESLGANPASKAKMQKLLELCEKFIPAEWRVNKELLMRALLTVEEKILQNPQDVQNYIAFYFKESLDIPSSLLFNKKMEVDGEIAKRALTEVLAALENFDSFDSQEKIKECLTSVIQKLGLKNGQVLWPTRVALTGEQFSPGVFEVAWALGKAKTVARIKSALNYKNHE